MLACRCCGRPVHPLDEHQIHTLCIRPHWGNHANGKSLSRCKEFGPNKPAKPLVEVFTEEPA